MPRGRDILLTRQMTPEPDIQLPGGGIDAGESAIHALHREVFEETGWLIARPKFFGAFRRFVWMPEYELWAEKLCKIFVARPVRPLSDPIEPNHQWYFEDLRSACDDLGNDGDRAMLKRFMRARLPQRTPTRR